MKRMSQTRRTIQLVGFEYFMSKSIKCLVRQRNICLWEANANRIAVKRFAEYWLMNSDKGGRTALSKLLWTTGITAVKPEKCWPGSLKD